eukprot:scpid84026/ scgid24916/ Malcavernin; Cerebral cavernous malformations 2 protein
MPTNLERRLSSKSDRARRSIRPRASEERESSDSDDSGPGAVEADFFTPPRRERPEPEQQQPEQQQSTNINNRRVSFQVSSTPDATVQAAIGRSPAEIVMKQASAARVVAKQPTELNLGQPTSSMDQGQARQRAMSQSPGSGVNGVVESPQSHNSQRVRTQVTDKELVEKSVIRHCQYLGDISQVPMTFNINSRSRLLNLIDNSRRQGRLPWTPHNKHNVCLALCAKDLRLLDHRGQAVIVRLPLHTIAAVSYFHDDLQHLVTIHTGAEGDRGKGLLHILHFSTQEAAEEVCMIISKCFNLLYTEATMAMLDQSIVDGNGGELSPLKSPGRSLTRGLASDQYYPNISSSLVAELHDVQRIAAPSETSANISAPKRGGILRQPSRDAMPVSGVKQSTAPLAPPAAPALAGGIVTATSSGQATNAATASPPPPPPAPSAPDGPPAPPAPAAMPPPSNRPALVQAVGQSRRKPHSETPGVGLVAVYDDSEEEESDSDHRRHAGQPLVARQQVQEQPQEKEMTEEAAVVVQRYMKVMHHLVSSEELRQFATLVKEYRDNLPIATFCARLDTLFGPDRQFMLPGMRAFIPETDQFYFESFLQVKGAAELKIPDRLLQD